jgi:hypothetical protein
MTWYVYEFYLKSIVLTGVGVYWKMAWAIGFMNAGWTIQWMRWDNYLNAIISMNYTIFRNIQDVILIAGGLNLAIDYL